MLPRSRGPVCFCRGEIAETDVTIAEGPIAEIGGPAAGPR